MPCPGQITAFHPPTGLGIRLDTAAYTECVISPFYDSLIAKVISYGNNRGEAIKRMERALEMMIVEGVKTTIPLHQRVLANSDFREGKLAHSFPRPLLPPLARICASLYRQISTGDSMAVSTKDRLQGIPAREQACLEDA